MYKCSVYYYSELYLDSSTLISKVFSYWNYPIFTELSRSDLYHTDMHYKAKNSHTLKWSFKENEHLCKYHQLNTAYITHSTATCKNTLDQITGEEGGRLYDMRIILPAHQALLHEAVGLKQAYYSLHDGNDTYSKC